MTLEEFAIEQANQYEGIALENVAQEPQLAEAAKHSANALRTLVRDYKLLNP